VRGVRAVRRACKAVHGLQTERVGVCTTRTTATMSTCAEGDACLRWYDFFVRVNCVSWAFQPARCYKVCQATLVASMRQTWHVCARTHTHRERGTQSNKRTRRRAPTRVPSTHTHTDTLTHDTRSARVQTNTTCARVGARAPRCARAREVGGAAPGLSAAHAACGLQGTHTRAAAHAPAHLAGASPASRCAAGTCDACTARTLSLRSPVVRARLQ
jgi:hypothetical protein